MRQAEARANRAHLQKVAALDAITGEGNGHSQSSFEKQGR
jgi:hypothetical protein